MSQLSDTPTRAEVEVMLARPFTNEEVFKVFDVFSDALGSALRCNEGLRGAVQYALDHVVELRDAWQEGALSEHDGKGGTRSNRNVEVEQRLRAALKATP